MSFILDALKRAERERAHGAPPAAAQVIQQPSRPPSRPAKWLWATLLGLCVLLGGTVATIVWLVQQRPVAPQAVAAAPAPPPVAVSEPPPPPAAESKMSSLQDLSDDEPPPAAGGADSVPDSEPAAPPPADEAQASQLAAAPPPEAQTEAPPPSPPKHPLHLLPRGETAAPPRVDPVPRSVASAHGPIPGPVVQLPLQAPGQQQIVPPARSRAMDAASDVAVTTPSAVMVPPPPPRSLPPPPVDTAPPPAASAPLSSSLRQMPEAYRAQFPQLSVDIHVYNDDPKRRFVMVAGKRYHEGDTLAEGPRLIAIVPEGMVLDYQGQRVVYGLTR